MLNKEVCRVCVNRRRRAVAIEHAEVTKSGPVFGGKMYVDLAPGMSRYVSHWEICMSPWNPADDRLWWNGGSVFCGLEHGSFCVEGPPPTHCEYAVEHLVCDGVE